MDNLPDHGVTVAFVNFNNTDTKLELLYPYGDKSPIAKFLEKNPKGGFHHKCYEVHDIYEAIKHFKANNVRCLSEEPHIGAHGNLVTFLHPKDCGGVLIELKQS